ncbi:MAG: KamA family radical SAM protein [Candidatus Fermentibacteraceae bacterium]
MELSYETTRELEGPESLREVYRNLPSIDEDIGPLVRLMWNDSPHIHRALDSAETPGEAREGLFDYLEARERRLLSLGCRLHPLEKANSREAIQTFKNFLGRVCEKRAGCSTLDTLLRLAKGDTGEASACFVMEMIHLLRAVEGRSGIYGEGGVPADYIPAFLRRRGREAAVERTRALDREASEMHALMRRYRSGLEPEVVERRRASRRRIMEAMDCAEGLWDDYRWHLVNVVRDPQTLSSLVELSEDRLRAVSLACENGIPFGVTPYYMSLMDRDPREGLDHAVRAQVIPSLDYVTGMLDHKEDRSDFFDFMGERNTSPVDLVTRRYPSIAIFKPFNTCAQICVYCQRNWEIDQVMAPNALATPERVETALRWFEDHRELEEVLITGGDPCVMSDAKLRQFVAGFASMDHIRRIRIGTRTPVVLPMRWTGDLVEMLAGFNVPGVREVSVVTHFEHPYEITPEARDAVARIRTAGMSVYNQQVFTVENSRRFETARLRVDLRRIGVEPYYNFNMKGKEETGSLRVPIARILQERKEEARLLPGLDRTDESVFNVPNLGKNHLRAWQDHRLIMLRPDGRRVYEFHPWEKNLAAVPCYAYTDVPVLQYLQRLVERGEDPWDYRTIWYYY